MVAFVQDAPSTPYWHKTGATAVTPVAVQLPLGTRSVKIFVDALSYIALGATAVAPTVGAVDAVQTITTTGTPTGGTFTLRFRGQTTGNINYNSSAAAMDTALEALSTIGTGGVVSGGGALPTAITETFSAALFAGTPIPLLELASNALTGGTNPSVVIRTTTAGVNPYTYIESGQSDVFSIDEDFVWFVYVATVASTGNYRLSSFR